MDHRNQPRQPKGVPTGGQWRSASRPEGGIVLQDLGEPTDQEWSDAGFGAREAHAWKEGIFLPEEAAQWRDRLFGPEEAGEWRHALFGPVDASEWRARLFEPEEATQWERSGFEPAEAHDWRSFGFEGPAAAKAWQDNGFQEAADAAPWSEGGFEPDEAGEWAKAGAMVLGTHYESTGENEPVRQALIAIGGEDVRTRRRAGLLQVTDKDRRLHSVAGMPAVRSSAGYAAWADHGLPHRENGPARVWADGRREYWHKGQRLATYSPPGWAPPLPGPGWARNGPDWEHTACPCRTGPVPVADHDGAGGGALAVCPACGDQVAI